VRRGGEDAHVGPGLGDDDVGDALADAGDADQQVPGQAEGCQDCFDPAAELLNGPGVPVDDVQVQSGQERMMGVESAVEGFGQGRDLRPKAVNGKIGQHHRVALALNEGRQHRPGGDTRQIRGNGGQLDPGVFQELLQALDLTAALPGHRRLGAFLTGLHIGAHGVVRYAADLRGIPVRRGQIISS
jgi:hypothetical protein